jgi:tRNA nucleotidyltransferase/poly(A) polymerase
MSAARAAASPPGLTAVLALHDHPVVRRVAAAARGVPVHLVGGMIRDAWLGRPTHDVDVVVAGRGEEIAHRLAADLPARFVALGGKAFAAYRLVGEGFHLDLWDREATSLGEDLARRDFTVNSIALDLARGEPERSSEALADPFGGLADLEQRILRATTEASFEGDPLRVLRLARFVVELPGFTAEAATRGLARQAAPGVARVAAERVREELLRLLAGEAAHRGFEEMTATGLYPGLFVGRPGDLELAGAEAEARGARLAAELRALPAAVERLRVRSAGTAPGVPCEIDTPAARLASAVLQAPGDAVGALTRLQELGYLARRETEAALPLVNWARLPPAGSQGVTEQRRLLHRLGRHWATALAWLGARAAAEGTAASWEQETTALLRLLADDGEWILDPPRLLTGGEVQELLGLGPGPEIGRALAALRQAQVENRVRTREEAVAWVQAL